VTRRPGAFARLPAAAILSTALVATFTVPGGLAAQSFDVKAYALGVGTQARAGDLGPGGTTLLGRFRLMPTWTDGPVSVEAAYEHIVTRTPIGGGVSVTTPGGAAASTGDWLGLDWPIRSTERTSWRQRFDRLSVGVDAGPVSLVVGRQAISWATTLFLTPADPFAPFDPSDPFREYRGGVDAVRVRAFAGPFTEMDVVVRPAKTPTGTTLTAVGRAQTSRGGWAFGAWGGVVHDEGAAAVFATGAAGATALRGSLALRRDGEGKATVRGAVGGDRLFELSGRDLRALVELQYDGFGAARGSDLLEVVASAPYLHGEMQTLGRWTTAAQASWQAHPLVSADAMALVNLGDGSALLAPGLSWSATASASVRAGAFVGVGRETSDPRAGLGSEYGSVPLLGYLALSVFF
jgi:hypothetical protein